MRVERDRTHLQVSFDFIEDIFAASSEQYGTRLRVRALLEEREVPEQGQRENKYQEHIEEVLHG